MTKIKGEYKWEVTLPDKQVITESDDTPFNLDWEAAGAVSKFLIKEVDGSNAVGVNLSNGKFIVNGKEQAVKGFSGGSLGDYSLRFFRRIQRKFNQARVEINSSITPYVGYMYKGKEKLMNIPLGKGSPNFADRKKSVK